jgi:prophage maintenance system killer protein
VASASISATLQIRRFARSSRRDRTHPDLIAKAALLLHSIARNHALIDGNKRFALAAVMAFHGLNGRRLTLTTPWGAHPSPR